MYAYRNLIRDLHGDWWEVKRSWENNYIRTHYKRVNPPAPTLWQRVRMWRPPSVCPDCGGIRIWRGENPKSITYSCYFGSFDHDTILKRFAWWWASIPWGEWC